MISTINTAVDTVRPPLSPRQHQLYLLICDYIRTKNRPPTFQEMADRMGIRSKNGITTHLAAMESKGYIRREAGVTRGLIVVDQSVYRRPYSIPIVGRVSAGQLSEACELQEWLSLGDLLGDDSNLSAVQVEGNGMLDRQIASGDFLIRRDGRNVLLWRSLAARAFLRKAGAD